MLTGDESGECGVPDYPDNIKVLLDSWRYQRLLGGDDNSESVAVWTTRNTESGQDEVVSLQIVPMHVLFCSIYMVFCTQGSILLP